MSKMAGVAVALMAFASIGQASSTTINFDPTQPTPPGQTGLPPMAGTPASMLSYWGVAFQSSALSDPSICNDQGPLCFGDTIGTADLGLHFLVDDVLSGSLTGSPNLTLTFLSPTTVLDFGAVVGTSTTELLSVALFGPGFSGTSPLTIQLQAIGGAVLSEGQFSYSGQPITQAVITFSSDSTPIFAIDNLTYNVAAPAVPEPNPFTLLTSGLLFIGLFTRLRRARWSSWTSAPSE
jgi:hypothetical protein